MLTHGREEVLTLRGKRCLTFTLFEAGGKHAKGGSAGSGTTGLPNAGAASDEGKTLKHWREIAGLTDDDKKE